MKRLLALGWTYRRRCLTVLGYQSILLALGLFGLGLTGVAVDVIRHQMDPHAPLPRWPLGWTPPAAWSAMGLLLAVGVLVLAMAVLRGGLNYLYTIAVGQLVHAEIVPQMRTAAYDKLQRMSFRFFDATASGSIINRVTSDVQSVRAFVDQVLIQSVILVLTLGVYVVYMMQKHVGLTFACISTSPFLWLAATLFSRWVQPAYAKNRKLSDDLVTFFSETVQGIRVLKGFAREPQRLEAFEEKNRLLRDQQYGIFRQVSLFSPALDLLSQANLVVLLAFGASLVIQGRLTLGDLIVFAGLLQQFAGQVTNLANIINTLQQSLISARRVFEVMDAPLEIESPPAAARPQRLTGAIRFENVDFGYRQGEQPCDLAVTGIDFEARPGQRVILFGETGSGKSTILSLIPRFYDPARGRVLVDGADVRGLDLEVLRGHTGVVFQESFLFSAGIADNIGFGRPQATQQEIEAAAKLARAHEFILGLPQGYETVVEEGGANLSGGQRQRLAIARALLRDPAILLLDDPTAAVDAQTEDELLAALGTIAAGRTTLIATHRLGPCYGADLILVLHDGRIVERGTHDQLLAAGGRYFAAAELHRVAQVRRATA